MKKDVTPDSGALHPVLDHFNATFSRHIEGLLGPGKQICGFSPNLVTLSCMVLLAEREGEIGSLGSRSPERYIKETLFRDLSGLGLNFPEEVKRALREMITNGYIQIASDGRLSASETTLNMVKLLNQLFPKMPGITFVAYFGQTIDEVLSGRKDLESAIGQFDQTLHIHGVAVPKKARGSRVHQRDAFQRRETHQRRDPADTKKLALAEIFRKRQTKKNPEQPPRPAPESKVVIGGKERNRFEVTEIFPKGDSRTGPPDLLTQETQPQKPGTPKYELPGTDSKISGADQSPAIECKSVCEPTAVLKEKDVQPRTEPDSEEFVSPRESSDAGVNSEPMQLEGKSALPSLEEQEKGEGPSTEMHLDQLPAEVNEEEADSPSPHEKGKTDNASNEYDTVIRDESIENRIQAFQQDLATACPVCNTGRIQKKQTVKGKFYYVCSNKDCLFISWGKPYHIVCPVCNNRFLVETTDRNGKVFLKCPRATCRHRQRLPGETAEPWPDNTITSSPATSPLPEASQKPRKRVIRRRRIRKKR